MKKLFLLSIIPALLVVGCAKDPGKPLPPPSPESYTVVLTPTNSMLTSADSTEEITVSLKAQEDESITYDVKIGFPCYLKQVQGTNYQEIIMKNGAYFKSASTYKVSRILCDIYGGKGVNYTVHNTEDGSGDPLEYHESTVTPTYPEDSGFVYEYEVEANGWSIRNSTMNKPAFYSVTIVFEVEK